MFARLLRQMTLFIVSLASSIVVGWLLMDQMERNRREEERLREIPVPRGDHRNGASERVNAGTASAPPAPPRIVPKPAASTSKKSAKADDLTIIEGIGPAYAKALNALGITTFAELAQQDADDLAGRMGNRVNATRIRQQDWIGQAKQLSS
jgi:predicted flap endonuclease-1-like 5' DNA nuclease